MLTLKERSEAMIVHIPNDLTFIRPEDAAGIVTHPIFVLPLCSSMALLYSRCTERGDRWGFRWKTLVLGVHVFAGSNPKENDTEIAIF